MFQQHANYPQRNLMLSFRKRIASKLSRAKQRCVTILGPVINISGRFD